MDLAKFSGVFCFDRLRPKHASFRTPPHKSPAQTGMHTKTVKPPYDEEHTEVCFSRLPAANRLRAANTRRVPRGKVPCRRQCNETPQAAQLPGGPKNRKVFVYFFNSQYKNSGIFLSQAIATDICACSSVGHGSFKSTIVNPALRNAFTYSSIVLCLQITGIVPPQRGDSHSLGSK